MAAQLFERTNKAEIYRLGDGSVLKRYVDQPERRARLDRTSLEYLQKNFLDEAFEGWT